MASTMADRAEHGTKVISSDATMRSRPAELAATADRAGTLQPSPSRKGHRHAAVQADAVEPRSTNEGDPVHDPDSSRLTSSSTSGSM